MLRQAQTSQSGAATNDAEHLGDRRTGLLLLKEVSAGSAAQRRAPSGWKPAGGPEHSDWARCPSVYKEDDLA